MAAPYLDAERAPSKEELSRTPGLVLLEFGTAWCGICRGLAPQVEQLLAEHPRVRHLKVEDGPGRPLGRSFGVKLWPTLVLLRDGAVVRQLVRPGNAQLREAFGDLAGRA